MSRPIAALFAFAAVSLAGSPAGHAKPPIPGYFFKEWTIRKDCSEQHAGSAGHVQTGLKFRITRESADGLRYRLQAIDVDRRTWSRNWRAVRLEYRAGIKMRSLPADFECVPGQETSSPFLAMSNYSQTAEPWYEFEHWYGILRIHGEPHHLLVFPRDVDGESSAIIILQDADSSGTIKLDHNGSIHAEH